jgi:hypothetical protein
MLLWSVMVGILGVCGTGVWVTYLSRQRTQYGLQWYWFYGLVALLPAWLVAFLSLLTPPSGGGQVICARIPWVPLDNLPLGCNGHTLLFARLAAIEDIKRLRRQPL